jgi:hypothetical protein
LPANAPPGGNCVPALATGCKINSDCCGGGTCIGAKALPDGTATGGVCTSSSLALDSGGAYQAKDFPSPTPACQPSGDGYLCTTAIGNIQTSAQGFVQAIMDLVLSIVGGIAVLLIIISGYRLMVSQGNPEGIKNAKDQLTAAIIGLLFVIFSLVILQIIGYNILGLPGFKP